MLEGCVHSRGLVPPDTTHLHAACCRFLRPLYRALHSSKSAAAKQAALDTFAKHRSSYHPIASKMVGLPGCGMGLCMQGSVRAGSCFRPLQPCMLRRLMHTARVCCPRPARWPLISSWQLLRRSDSEVGAALPGSRLRRRLAVDSQAQAAGSGARAQAGPT